MAKTTFEASRFSGFVFEPEFVVIIGLDTEDGPEHHLYDERIELPIDEGMVVSIMAIGVRETIKVTKGFDGRPIVVDGRRRVRHAREANKRLRKLGEPLVTVRAVAESGSEEYLSHVSIALNEIRVQDGVLVKAAKSARMLARGHTELDVATSFGVSTASIRAWQKLEELPAPVKKAVADGVLSANAASKLHGLPREEILAKLEELKGEHAQTGKKATARKVDKGGPSRPTKKVLGVTLKKAQKACVADASDEYYAGVRDALRFALGFQDALSMLEDAEEDEDEEGEAAE